MVKWQTSNTVTSLSGFYKDLNIELNITLEFLLIKPSLTQMLPVVVFAVWHIEKTKTWTWTHLSHFPQTLDLGVKVELDIWWGWGYMDTFIDAQLTEIKSCWSIQSIKPCWFVQSSQETYKSLSSCHKNKNVVKEMLMIVTRFQDSNTRLGVKFTPNSAMVC